MKEESLTQMSEMALSNGYMFKPINMYGPEDKQRITNNVSELFKDQAMNDFVLYNIIDRLTYVRDYNVRKSLNFMMTVKDKKGETIAFAEMVYSKSSEMLYVKTFKVQEGHNEKEVLALSIKGAKDHLKDHGLKFNTILTSPKVSDNKENLNIMMDMGMKFMAFTPKTDYGTLHNNKENTFNEKNEVILFPFKEKIEEVKPSNLIKSNGQVQKMDKKKQDKLWADKKNKLNVEKEMLDEMRVLLVKKYGNEKLDLTQDKFKRFLNDVKEEETELAYLFKLFKKENDVKITLRKMDEIEKLLFLFNKWDEEHKKEQPEEKGSKKIDYEILKLIKNFNKKKN